MAQIKAVLAWLLTEWGSLSVTIKTGIISGAAGFLLGKLL